MNIKNWIPALEWIPQYSSDQLKGDLIAGLTVGVMLIPQGMAYAMIAGLPPIYGLYASTIPIIIYAIFGTSRQLAVGPVAMVSLLTATGIGALAEGGTEAYIMLAITLAFFVGLIQLLLGVMKLGFLVNFLSHPVISGFTSAAALIIGLSQLKHLLGIHIPRSHHIHEILLNALRQMADINWVTFVIGIVGIIVIKGVKYIGKAIPGPLVTVILGVLVVYLFGLTEFGVKIVGVVPEGLPSMSFPDLSIGVMSTLLPIALAIALVSFMESIAVAKAIQTRHKDYEVLPNQELIALGLANIGGSLFQSYPVTGGFSRTAVNDQAGAKTGMASLISAALIIISLLFLTPLFYYLPKALLASVIMVAVFGLIDFKEAKHLWYTDRSDFWMLVVTFIATLSLGIELGIGLGVMLSLAMIIFRSTQPHTVELGRVKDTIIFRNIERYNDVERQDDLVIMRFDSELYFANIGYFREKLTEFVDRRERKIRAVIVNAEGMNHIDSSAIHALKDLNNNLEANDIRLLFSGLTGPVRDILKRNYLLDELGEDSVFMCIQDAVDHFNERDELRSVSKKSS